MQGGFTEQPHRCRRQRGLGLAGHRPARARDAQLPQKIWSWPTGTACCRRSCSRRRSSRSKQSGLPRTPAAPSTAILDSPFRTRGLDGIPASQHYNAPFFDSTDPEDRNNRQFTGSLSTLLSSGKGGSHDLKGGFEWFRSTNTGGNSQTSTGYVFYSDYVNNARRAGFDGHGRLIPRFVPGDVAPLQLAGDARREHRHQDHVALRARSLGGEPQADGRRWACATSACAATPPATSSAPTPTRVVPRLAATFDAKGDGRWVMQGTYAHYAGKYSEAQFASNTDVAQPEPDPLHLHGSRRVRASTSRRASTSTTTRRSSTATSPPPTSRSRTASTRR